MPGTGSRPQRHVRHSHLALPGVRSTFALDGTAASLSTRRRSRPRVHAAFDGSRSSSTTSTGACSSHFSLSRSIAAVGRVLRTSLGNHFHLVFRLAEVEPLGRNAPTEQRLCASLQRTARACGPSCSTPGSPRASSSRNRTSLRHSGTSCSTLCGLESAATRSTGRGAVSARQLGSSAVHDSSPPPAYDAYSAAGPPARSSTPHSFVRARCFTSARRPDRNSPGRGGRGYVTWHVPSCARRPPAHRCSRRRRGSP